MTRHRNSRPSPKPKTNVKPRSLRHPRNYFIAVFFSAVHFIVLLAAIASAVIFAFFPQELTMRLLLGSVGLAIFTWILAYYRRRAALCPLCKGTPLLNSGALPHVNAWRLRPLNYGVSAVLSCLFTHRFRCMYCGSRYDLLRQPRDQRADDEAVGL